MEGQTSRNREFVQRESGNAEAALKTLSNPAQYEATFKIEAKGEWEYQITTGCV